MKNRIIKFFAFSSVMLSAAANASDCHYISKAVAKQLQDAYVIETTANKLSQLISSTEFIAKCGKQESPESVAQFMTVELNKIPNDKHLAVIYDPAWVNELTMHRATNSEETFADKRALETPTDNYGFKKVEILEGNIGYLDIRSFADSHLGGETLENTMKFLKYTDGMIIDLRHNFGGSPFMVTTLASYFFDSDTVHLFTAESRADGVTTQLQDWTSPYVPGPRFKDTPLYILTSRNSASAAEAFSYAMKNLDRATLVGEVTAGAAHGRRVEIINNSFLLTLPTTRPVDPRTQSNWERTGVVPTVAATSDNALNVAYAGVLKELINQGNKNKGLHQWVYPVVNAKSKGYKAQDSDLQQIIGTYGNRKIYQEKGKLFYQYIGDSPFEIELLDKETIAFKAFTSARLEVVYQGDKVKAIRMLQFGDKSQEFDKTI